jgi:hypothetical protein
MLWSLCDHYLLLLLFAAGGSLLDEQSQLDCEITGDCDDIAASAAIR